MNLGIQTYKPGCDTNLLKCNLHSTLHVDAQCIQWAISHKHTCIGDPQAWNKIGLRLQVSLKNSSRYHPTLKTPFIFQNNLWWENNEYRKNCYGLSIKEAH
jgi:hypothetical protein